MAKTNEKITKIDFLNYVIALEGVKPEMVEKAKAMLETEQKRKATTSEKKNDKNAELIVKILDYLAENPGSRVGEIAVALGETQNRVNSLLAKNRLGFEGTNQVRREEVKKVAYFYLNEVEDTNEDEDE